MIIEHIPGPDGKAPKTDTDKLTDTEAMILEKAEELRLLCFSVNRQCVILVDAKGAENGNSMHFWNMKTKDHQNFTDEETLKKVQINLLTMVHGFLMNISGGTIGLNRMDTGEHP